MEKEYFATILFNGWLKAITESKAQTIKEVDHLVFILEVDKRTFNLEFVKYDVQDLMEKILLKPIENDLVNLLKEMLVNKMIGLILMPYQNNKTNLLNYQLIKINF